MNGRGVAPPIFSAGFTQILHFSDNGFDLALIKLKYQRYERLDSMDIFSVLTMIGGLCLFLFGMNLFRGPSRPSMESSSRAET